MRNSLRTRLTIYFILMALLPLILLGVDGIFRTLRVQQEQALNLQSQVAQNVATEVESFINARADELNSLTAVNGFAYLSPEEQAELMNNLLTHEDLFDELTLIDEQGQELLRFSRYAFYGEEDLENRTGLDEFEYPRDTQEVYFSSVEFNENTGEPFVTISVPLVDLRSGEFTGVLAADFRFKPIWDLIASAEVPGSGIVYMLDDTDLLVAHRNPSLVLQETIVTIPSVDSFTQGLSNSDVALAFDEIVFGEEIFRIVAEQPSSEALALANENLRSTLIVLAISAIGAAVIGAIAAGRISKPLNILASTAEAVASGDLEQHVEVTSKDEIGILGTAFNSMTEQLRNLVGNLEQRVSARTRDLELANEIGRNVSEIRDANQILTEAVKLIHNDFDLYLAQVYLIEDDQETMLLQAAEGQAASRLLAQGHYLAVNTASINGTAVSEKRAIVVSDTAQDPLFRPNPLLPDTRSEMAAPMMIADRVVGVLDMQSTIANTFTEENIPAFNAIASQLTISLDNASLFSEREKTAVEMEIVLSETEQQAESLSKLNEMGAELASASNIDEVYQIIGSQMLNIVSGNLTSLALITDQKDTANVIVLQGEQKSISTSTKISLTGTTIDLALQENRIVQLPKESPLSTYTDSRQLAQQGVQSFIVSPLIASGQIIGTLNIGSTHSYAFTEADINLVRQIATLLATTINSKNLINRVQNLASIVEGHPDFIGTGTLQGEALYTNPAGLTMLGLPADYDVSGMQATDFYPEEDAELLIQEGIPTALEAGSWTSEGHLLRTDGETIPIEQTIAINFDEEDKATGFSITMRDISKRLEAVEAQRKLTTQLEERLLQVNAMQRAMTHEGWSAFLTSPNRMVQGFKFGDEQLGLISKQDLEQGEVPIIEGETLTQPDPATAAAAVQVRGETIGAIGAKNKNGEPLDEEQLAMLNSLTQQVAEALDRARLFEEMELAREQMNALYAGSDSVVRAQSIDEVLAAIVRATALRRTDRGTILFFDRAWTDIEPEKLFLAASWTKSGQSIEPLGTEYLLEHMPSIRLVSKDQPAIFPDIVNDELLGPDAKALAENFGVKSIAFFPLVVGEQWLGVLTVQSFSHLNLSKDEIRQITSLVDQAASVTQTQRLYDQTQSRVRREQLLREVTEKVYAAPDAESIMKTAVKEVNRIMGVDSFVYLDDPSTEKTPSSNGSLETNEETTNPEG